MATVGEYALMADAVYDDEPYVEGWSLAPADFKASGSGLTEGFQGAAFRRGAEVVFAFKGTSGGRDVVADAKLAVGMNTHQYAEAYEFVSRVGGIGNPNASLCGHSLGGATAQIVGNRARLPFVTFNAPGVGLFSRNLGETAATLVTGSAAVRLAGTVTSALWHPMQAARDAAAVFNVVKGVNFRLGADVVGSIGVHYGKVVEVSYGGGAMDLIAKHKMVNFIPALQSSPYWDSSLESVV